MVLAFERNRRGQLAIALAATLAILAVSVFAIWSIQQSASEVSGSRRPLIVYCAASVRPAVEPILQQFEQEFGRQTSLQIGPSGGLGAQIKLSGKGDLFIPAAIDPFLLRMQQEDQIAEIIPLARLKLVVALSPDNSESVETLVELARAKWSIGYCNPQAAAGDRALATLETSEQGRAILDSATATFPTVTELAGAIRDGGRLDAGLIWNTTAQQYGLRFVELPELEASESTIGVGVLGTSGDAEGALHLARYLAAQDRGQRVFREHNYEVVGEVE